MSDARLLFAQEIIKEAGAITLKYFRKSFQTELKADFSPLTIADLECENFLRQKIAESFPRDGIYGEEQAKSGDQSQRWVIDPIDGTKSFVCGVPLYSVLLSYEINEIPVLGLCYVPAVDELYFASTGNGAFCNNEPIQVSEKRDFENAVICCAGHKSMHNHGYDIGLNRISNDLMASRTWCDAYGHMMVARGDAVAMIDPVLEHYDISAPWLIVREAGGKFTTIDGKSDLPGASGLSSNGIMHEAILKIIHGDKD